MKSLTSILQFSYKLIQNIIGITFYPYKTYFHLTHEKTPSLGIVFMLLVPFYVVFATILRNGLFHVSLLFLFTTFGKYTIGIWTAFLLSFFALLIMAELLKQRDRKLIIFNLWAFSYIPTYIWFGVTAILFLLLPPPRTESLLGQSFSIFFISFSLFVFLWKLLLYYLTLRIGLRMTLLEVVLASILLFPLFGIFSLASYKMGIFRVPFV
jgi:hypothetical protein